MYICLHTFCMHAFLVANGSMIFCIYMHVCMHTHIHIHTHTHTHMHSHLLHTCIPRGKRLDDLLHSLAYDNSVCTRVVKSSHINDDPSA